MQVQRETAESFCVEGQKRLEMSAVDSVDGFHERELKLTVAGKKMTVTGKGIKITAFDKATGRLTADGTFSGVSYAQQKVPFFKRLFR